MILRRVFVGAFCTLSLFFVTPDERVFASVVMLNTRVIYPAETASQTVQLTNNDSIPYVIQMWSDVNNLASTPDNADGPFVAVPALFRIEPNTGQSVRIIYTGRELPQDRESVFYLNVVQVPPKNISGAQNQMVVLLRNRLKVFYRPKGIPDLPEILAERLHFSLEQKAGQWSLSVHNDSGYYASLVRALVVTVKRNEVPFLVDMVAPYSRVSWPIIKGSPSPSGAQKVRFTFVNDYGGLTQAEASLWE